MGHGETVAQFAAQPHDYPPASGWPTIGASRSADYPAKVALAAGRWMNGRWLPAAAGQGQNP
jgi:hypothetical protein